MKPVKVAILTSQPRVEKYYDLTTLPDNWELIFFSADFTEEEVLCRAGDADFIFADAIAPVSRNLIEGMPNLKMIHSEGVAYNRYDLEAARERGIYVCNNAAANSASVAEHTVLLMLALNSRLMEGDQMVRRGQQIQTKTRYILEGIPELYACHVGLVGFGAIGQATARLLMAFGCRVSYCAAHRKPELEESMKVQWLEGEEIAAQCDIVSLHLPVTSQTTHLVDARFLARMKPTALLINTARGEIVDQQALASALEEGRIAGAGLDTLSPEPVRPDNPLLHLSPQASARVIFSPHVAGTTRSVFYNIHRFVWENIQKCARGERPDNIVNG